MIPSATNSIVLDIFTVMSPSISVFKKSIYCRIRKKTGLWKLKLITKERRLRRLGHVLRMKDSRIPCQWEQFGGLGSTTGSALDSRSEGRGFDSH